MCTPPKVKTQPKPTAGRDMAYMSKYLTAEGSLREVFLVEDQV